MGKDEGSTRELTSNSYGLFVGDYCDGGPFHDEVVKIGDGYFRCAA